MRSLENNPKLDKKLLLLATAMLACLMVLIVGLWNVQVVDRDEYEKQMQKQYSVSVRLPSVRGKILDVDGNPLAENRPSFTINLYLEELRGLYQKEYYPVKKEMLQQIAADEGIERGLTSRERSQVNKRARYNVMQRLIGQLGEIMEEEISISEKEFENHYNRQLSMPLPVMPDISLAQTTKFLESVSIPPGFEIDIQPVRTYPQGDLASQTLGYMIRRRDHEGDDGLETKYQLQDYKGVAGLEGYFEEALKGKPGIKNITVNYLGYRTSENIAIEPIAGKDVHLTIDSDIQRAAQNALLKTDKNRKGAVVVMDSRNGDLLALASVPGYDPNQFIPRISHEEWEKINPPHNPGLKKLRNRSHAERYQPGSIYKIAVALALLESDDFDPENSISTQWVFVQGERPNQIRIRDTAAAGEYNFIKAFKRSSNYYFVDHGLNIGRRAIIGLSQSFGFHRPIELPLLQSAQGIIPTDEYIKKRGMRWTAGRTANLAIGQGEIALTPVHIAQMMCSIANNGHIPKPRLVISIQDSGSENQSKYHKYFPTDTLTKIPLKERSVTYLKQAMLADVEDSDGTGRRAFVEGMRIGGKTGTAESSSNKTTWFASMAPIDEPRYIVVVMAEEDFLGSGGKTCAPIARDVYLSIKQKYPSVFEKETKPSDNQDSSVTLIEGGREGGPTFP